MKFDHILKAPAQNLFLVANSDPERRALVCRIVVFELSRKVNFTTEYVYWATEGYLTRLVENLRWGCPMGQHDGIYHTHHHLFCTSSNSQEDFTNMSLFHTKAVNQPSSRLTVK